MSILKKHPKYFLLATNLVICALGIVILSFGAWLFKHLETHPYGTDFPKALSITFMVIGGSITLLVMIANVMVHLELYPWLLKFYLFIGLVALVSQLVVISKNYTWKNVADCDIKYSLQV